MPAENLTRDEARARAAVVSVDSYDVTLDPADVFADSRIRLDALAGQNELVVLADGAYMNTGEGLHRFVDPVDDEVYLYSQFEVADSRRVFAVFEQPDLKATFAFTVTAPAHWQVVSNYPAIGEPVPVPGGTNRNGGVDQGTATWTFERTPRLASYVTAVIAGPYHAEHGELTSSDGRTIPLAVYCRGSLAQHLDTEEILDITRRGFAFYEEKFDFPYPYPKYDQLFVPEFNAGAMENVGAVTFLENYVFRSKVPEATVERRAVTILHELAHMWFGDLVTMRWWDDLWLNESFAEFASTLATAEATRWTTAWTTFSSLEKGWAYGQDQLPSTHPIAADIRDLEDVEVNFDGITYAKGASVLRQLVAWVGEEEFFAGVRAYFVKHAWGNTELRDLLTELELTSGRDLTAWSALWLENSGVTLLRPQLTSEPAAAPDQRVITSFAVQQEVPATHPVQRPHRVAIGGYDVQTAPDGTTRLERTLHLTLDIDGSSTAVPELVGKRLPDLLLVNDDDLAYAKIRLDERSLRTATEHLADFTAALPRTLVWAAAWDATRDGETAARDYLELLLHNIGRESDSSVVFVLLRQLATAVDLYVAPEHRAATEVAVADRLWELAAAAEAGSDSQLQLTKSFAGRASTTAQLDRVAALLDGSAPLADLSVDTDLRWELLTSLVTGGRAGEADIVRQLEADPTATGQRAAAAARAAVPTPEAKAAAWAAVVDGDELPNALQAATIAGFGRVHDRSLLRPYVAPYFDALEQVWAERTNEIAQNIVVGLYPSDLADDAESSVPAVTDAWLAEHPDAPAALRRLVVEARDGVRRALAAQARDRARG